MLHLAVGCSDEPTDHGPLVGETVGTFVVVGAVRQLALLERPSDGADVLIGLVGGDPSSLRIVAERARGADWRNLSETISDIEVDGESKLLVADVTGDGDDDLLVQNAGELLLVIPGQATRSLGLIGHGGYRWPTLGRVPGPGAGGVWVSGVQLRDTSMPWAFGLVHATDVAAEAECESSEAGHSCVRIARGFVGATAHQVISSGPETVLVYALTSEGGDPHNRTVVWTRFSCRSAEARYDCSREPRLATTPFQERGTPQYWSRGAVTCSDVAHSFHAPIAADDAPPGWLLGAADTQTTVDLGNVALWAGADLEGSCDGARPRFRGVASLRSPDGTWLGGVFGQVSCAPDGSECAVSTHRALEEVVPVNGDQQLVQVLTSGRPAIAVIEGDSMRVRRW